MSHYSGSVPETRRKKDWRDSGLCREEEPEAFFPVGASPKAKAQERHAKTICWRCPSLQPCGVWALERREPVGVWGGMSEAERRAILRRRGVRMHELPEDQAA